MDHFSSSFSIISILPSHYQAKRVIELFEFSHSFCSACSLFSYVYVISIFFKKDLYINFFAIWIQGKDAIIRAAIISIPFAFSKRSDGIYPPLLSFLSRLFKLLSFFLPLLASSFPFLSSANVSCSDGYVEDWWMLAPLIFKFWGIFTLRLTCLFPLQSYFVLVSTKLCDFSWIWTNSFFTCPFYSSSPIIILTIIGLGDVVVIYPTCSMNLSTCAYVVYAIPSTRIIYLDIHPLIFVGWYFIHLIVAWLFWPFFSWIRHFDTFFLTIILSCNLHSYQMVTILTRRFGITILVYFQAHKYFCMAFSYLITLIIIYVSPSISLVFVWRLK